VTHSTTLSLIGYTWGALGLVWLIGLAFTRRTVRRHAVGVRLFHLALASVGFALLGSNWFAHTWMAMRFLPQSQLFDTVGLALTVAGCAFAVWARITLGRNWSGQATIKSGHEVIVTGPYALARHPIYTGFVTAAIGTAFAVGEIRCVLGLVVIVLALMIKMSQEEKLMMQTFPDVYARYRQHVRALIPGFL
jgi:protein-S-isoprenylcysteine O-methyltransferase Ste14